MAKSEDYFETLFNVGKSIQASRDREEILNLIVESAVSVMKAKACSLFLIRSRRDMDGLFYPAAQVGLSEDYIHSGPAKGRDITNDILLKGGYLAATDATSDPRLENHEAKKKEGIASLLIVPVMTNSKPIGILALYTAKKREFSEQEIDFLKKLAELGGLAIMRAHREYSSKRTIELLSSVAENLSSSLDIKAVLHIMTSQIADAFDLLGVSIRLKNEEIGELQLVASYGLSAEYLEKGDIDRKRLKAVLSNKPEIVEDIETADIDYKKERKAEGIVSMLHLPITVHGENIGLMGLYDDKAQAISEEQISLMSSIARLCGLAIHNASLFLQVKQDKQNLEEEIWGHKAWF